MYKRFECWMILPWCWHCRAVINKWLHGIPSCNIGILVYVADPPLLVHSVSHVGMLVWVLTYFTLDLASCYCTWKTGDDGSSSWVPTIRVRLGWSSWIVQGQVAILRRLYLSMVICSKLGILDSLLETWVICQEPWKAWREHPLGSKEFFQFAVRWVKGDSSLSLEITGLFLCYSLTNWMHPALDCL